MHTLVEIAACRGTADKWHKLAGNRHAPAVSIAEGTQHWRTQAKPDQVAGNRQLDGSRVCMERRPKCRQSRQVEVHRNRREVHRRTEDYQPSQAVVCNVPEYEPGAQIMIATKFGLRTVKRTRVSIAGQNTFVQSPSRNRVAIIGFVSGVRAPTNLGGIVKVDGQCHCGAITYEAEVEPNTISICNCADCQRQSGTVFRANVPAPSDKFRILSGTPRTYEKTADSGARRIHAFCDNCGGPIYACAAENPQIFSLRLGTLNQRYELGAPYRQIWTKRRFAWLTDLDGIPGTEGQP
ncbi:GFA family protein [Caballeronia sp. LjRoot31]